MVVVLIKYKVFAVTTKLGFVAMKDPEFDQEYPWGMGEICEQKREHKNFKLIFFKTTYKISAQSSFHQCT